MHHGKISMEVKDFDIVKDFDSGKEKANIPLIKLDYTSNYGHEDRVDQNMSEMEWKRNKRGWRKGVFLHLLCMAVTNSRLLFKQSNGFSKKENDKII